MQFQVETVTGVADCVGAASGRLNRDTASWAEAPPDSNSKTGYEKVAAPEADERSGQGPRAASYFELFGYRISDSV
jgi:hypothetical protein